MARETALAQDSASLAFRARRLVIALVACLSLASSPVLAQSPAAQRDLTFVRVHCAQCHAIDKVSGSPLAIAPPFRTLHLTYHLICPSFGSPLSGQCPERRGVGAVFLPSRIGRILCELVRTPPFASTNRAYPLKISHDLRVSLRDSLPVELDLVHPPIQQLRSVRPFAGENREIGSANAHVAGDAFRFSRTTTIKVRHSPAAAVPASPPMRKPTNKAGSFTCLS